MATNNMHNLTTLIKRLEAATSRLEDIASSAGEFEQSEGTNGLPKQPNKSQKGVPAAAAGVAAAGASPTAKSLHVPPMITDFDTLINGDLKEFGTCSKVPALGGVVAEQSDVAISAFQAQRQFLLLTTKAKKPDQSSPVYMETLQGLLEQMNKVDDLRQTNRASPFKDHLAMVADGVGALAWITIEPKPADYVADLFGGAQMYGNKVLKEHKEKDQAHVEWVKSFYRVMRSLIAYVKQHHSKGIAWNPQGLDVKEALSQASATATSSKTPAAPPLPSSGGAPPPPPPPPPPGLPPAPAAKKAPAADMGAVFADLNRGANITSGLKKVDPSQMTHKNPTLRAGAVVPERSNSSSSTRGNSPSAPSKKPKPDSLRTKKPARKELDGNKWIIENFESPSSPLEIRAEQNHSILITKCKATTIRIHGKANAISIDNCPKTSIILDSLVSSLDVIKCPSFAVQVLDTIPTILLDQVDGASIYLSKGSLATEVFTSKCSSINVNLPPLSEADDYKEAPVPEQFRSFVRAGKLVTEIVEHAG